jgi:hypothetical protein
MISALLTTLLVITGLAQSLRHGGSGGLIARHGYNNRYSDAPGARQDHLG